MFVLLSCCCPLLCFCISTIVACSCLRVGMRLLDSTTREAILSTIRTLFSDKTKCPFFFKPAYVQVLSGEEEGVFGWITVNFLNGFFNNPSGVTMGALDLGKEKPTYYYLNVLLLFFLCLSLSYLSHAFTLL